MKKPQSKNQHESRLSSWQLVFVGIGTTLIVTPIIWDILTSIVASLKDVALEDFLTRGGAFVVGLMFLVVVGLVEIVKDFAKPKNSKFSK